MAHHSFRDFQQVLNRMLLFKFIHSWAITIKEFRAFSNLYLLLIKIKIFFRKKCKEKLSATLINRPEEMKLNNNSDTK